MRRSNTTARCSAVYAGSKARGNARKRSQRCELSSYKNGLCNTHYYHANKKHYEKTECVIFEVFAGYTIHIIFTNDVIASRKKLDETLGEVFESDTALAFHCHSTLPKHTATAWLIFPFAANAGTVAHECWHAIKRLLDWAGCERYENETVAYHLGFLVNEATSFQKKLTK